MRIVISPAKKLYEGPVLQNFPYTQPIFLQQAQTLIAILQEKDAFDIASLMKLSMKLADLNVQRYQNWHTPFTADNAKQTLFSFAGDVYQGLDAQTLSSDDIAFAQTHLRILSGLYGILRPLDLMQAYRLEMGTKLSNAKGNNLYDFWGNSITEQLNQELEADDTLINLASTEYFKVIQPKLLQANIITPTFKENKAGTYKVIGIYAKKARGLMTRYIIQNRISDVQAIKNFDLDGYIYNPNLSDNKTWVFSRG
ncbi:peroxide stress protein YaaA [Ghiorsea bivora]|uniref:peroxide stress protein YaaA n=1 Tax=Ghiorsea bivora TaxID=1485545 RepID=UPI0005713067|nr:peroxide stress protein YaaA [Ghiorsea bivora]